MNSVFTKDVLNTLQNYEIHNQFLAAKQFANETGGDALTKGEICEGVMGGRLVIKQYSDNRFVRFFQAIGDFFNFFNIVNGVSYNQKKIDAVVKKMEESLESPALKEALEKIITLDPNSKLAKLEREIKERDTELLACKSDFENKFKECNAEIKLLNENNEVNIDVLIEFTKYTNNIKAELESKAKGLEAIKAELQSKSKELEAIKAKVALANESYWNRQKIEV